MPPKPPPKTPERFESLVKSAAKMGPRPHDGSRPKPKKPVKKAAAKRKRRRA